MAEQNLANTYTFPGSQESVEVRTPQTPLSEVDLARAAIEQAVGAHEVDATDIDTRRVETLGATMVAASKANTQTHPEVYFNPSDYRQLAAVGYHVVNMRKIAMGIRSDESAA